MFEDVEEIVPAEGEREMHFYYNRTERVAHAPQIVQDYYADQDSMKPVRGFRIFFTKQNRFVFFALVFFVGFSWVYSALNRSRNQAVISDVVFNLSAFSYEDEVYVSLKSKYRTGKNVAKNQDMLQVPFVATVLAINSDNQVQEKIILDGIAEREGEQTIRTKFSDFDIKRVDVTVDCKDGSKELSAFVSR